MSSLPQSGTSVSTHSSTSSGNTSSNSSCVASQFPQQRLHQDISRLRVDKLELLRQALSAQHEVRQLRQREAQLETDLALAAAEIRRLQTQLKSSAPHDNPKGEPNPPNLRPRRTTTVHIHIPL